MNFYQWNKTMYLFLNMKFRMKNSIAHVQKIYEREWGPDNHLPRSKPAKNDPGKPWFTNTNKRSSYCPRDQARYKTSSSYGSSHSSKRSLGVWGYNRGNCGQEYLKHDGKHWRFFALTKGESDRSISTLWKAATTLATGTFNILFFFVRNTKGKIEIGPS